MKDDTGGQIQPYNGTSPFDAIKRTDEHGDYWLARELMPQLGYTKWERFGDVIDRARTSIAATGMNPDLHVSRRREPIGRNNQTRDDVRLTRHGAHMAAMNGDVRKPEVAAAQTYFSVKTYEQEIAEEAARESESLAPVRGLTNRDLARMVLEEADRADRETELRLAAEAKAAELVPLVAEIDQHRSKSQYVDVFVDGHQDATSFRVYCTQIQMPEQKFRAHLVACGIIYRKQVSRRFDRAKQAWDPVYEYHPRAEYKKWFHLKDQPEAPRHHNGQMRTTLYVSPLGKVKLLEWLKRHPLEGVA